MRICKLCGEKETYFGRTTQECHNRTSGHRGCFDEEKWDKSALSMHAREVHQTQFSLDIFTIAVVKKISPQRLRREEYKFVEKFKTKAMGLNRYKVQDFGQSFYIVCLFGSNFIVLNQVFILFLEKVYYSRCLCDEELIVDFSRFHHLPPIQDYMIVRS